MLRKKRGNKMFVFDLTKNHFNLATEAKLQIEFKIKYKKCL